MSRTPTTRTPIEPKERLFVFRGNKPYNISQAARHDVLVEEKKFVLSGQERGDGWWDQEEGARPHEDNAAAAANLANALPRTLSTKLKPPSTLVFSCNDLSLYQILIHKQQQNTHHFFWASLHERRDKTTIGGRGEARERNDCGGGFESYA
jgi:hypothetical protein